MVSTPHFLPLGSVSEPLKKISARGISVCEIREPKETADVKTSIKRDKNCRGQGGIVGQADIILHPVVKNDLQQELIMAAYEVTSLASHSHGYKPNISFSNQTSNLKT
ncbi:hypothetical protein CR513_09093, partial [Mucuna pruriens]